MSVQHFHGKFVELFQSELKRWTEQTDLAILSLFSNVSSSAQSIFLKQLGTVILSIYYSNTYIWNWLSVCGNEGTCHPQLLDIGVFSWTLLSTR